MTYVEVPGARLHVELDGDGPLLVMVPGAAGVAGVFRPVAKHLARRFTVLRYDRRGFVTDPVEFARRLTAVLIDGDTGTPAGTP